MATISKSKRVENYLRTQISQGLWGPGERVPPEAEIGTQLDVSYMTVRQAMMRLADSGILERRQRRGTYVAPQPRTAIVAIVCKAELLAQPLSVVFSRMLNAAMVMIEAHGFRPVIKTGHGSTVGEFISSVHLLDPPVLAEMVGILSLVELGPLEPRLIKAGVPAVSIVAGAVIDTHTVVFDYEAMLNTGAQLLHETGHDDFAIMYSEPPEGERGKDLYRQLNKLRLKTVGGRRDRLIECPHSYDCRYAYDTFKRYWTLGRRPRAILFDDDAVFDVASRAMLELGIKIPDELAFVTQGNVGQHYHFKVPVTVVEFDPAEAVRQAWKMLEVMIGGGHVPPTTHKITARIRLGQTH